jgi:uncharacterized membrane protein
LFTRVLLGFLPFLLSIVAISGLVYADRVVTNYINVAGAIFIKYLISFILCLFNFYCLPWVIFKMVGYERNELKSQKENSFMNKNNFLMILNSLVLPFIANAVITFYDTDIYLLNP